MYRMTNEKLKRKVNETRTQGEQRRGKPKRTWREEVNKAVEEREIPWDTSEIYPKTGRYGV